VKISGASSTRWILSIALDVFALESAAKQREVSFESSQPLPQLNCVEPVLCCLQSKKSGGTYTVSRSEEIGATGQPIVLSCPKRKECLRLPMQITCHTKG
jgi:hypothetical protein